MVVSQVGQCSAKPDHRNVKQGIYHDGWGVDNEVAFEQHVGNE
jgi:hypothetical protein